MKIDIDTSEVDRLASDFRGAPQKATPEIEKVVSRGALNIRRDARRLIRGQIRELYLPHYARSITYDIDPDGLGAEIGPESGKPQGGMGAAIEFGSSRNPPRPHLFPALEVELPKFESHLGRIMEESVS